MSVPLVPLVGTGHITGSPAVVAVSFRGAGRRRQRHREGIFNSEIQKEDWKENRVTVPFPVVLRVKLRPC